MNRHSIILSLALVLSATARAAVDPVLLGLVMPDAKVLYGVQVQQTLASPFGQFALSRVPQNEAITRFFAATGFEMQRDLREVLIASSSNGSLGDGSDALILAKGAFSPDRVIALAKTIGSIFSDYRGILMITPPHDRPPRVFAFLDATTLAIGSEPLIRGAIDRHTGVQAAFSGPLSKKALDAGVTQDAWFATISPLTDLIAPSSAGGFDPAPLLQSVTESWAGAHFDANGLALSAEGLTHSELEARGMAGLLRLVSGMVKGTPAAPLQNAQVTARGAIIRVTLMIPEQDLERSFPAAAPRRAAR